MAGLSHRAATALLIDLQDDVLGPRLSLGWGDWARRLSALDGRDWLLLDKLARRSTWAQPALLHGTRGWDSLDLAAAPVATVAAAAMHVDGRWRQRAARALGRHAGPVASAALALRILDHVPEVSLVALEGVTDHARGLEVDLIADVLLHATDRRVALERWDRLVVTLSLDSPAVLGPMCGSRRRRARRWAVEQSLAQGLLDDDTVLRIASKDPDQWLRRAAAEHLARTPTPERLAPLVRAESVEARLTALTWLPDDLMSDADLELLLLDRAPRVREQARWRARRRGDDVADVCRRHLAEPTPRVVAAALDGLASAGNETDVPALGELLRHPSPTVRAAAVRAVAVRVPGPDATDVLAPCLTDPSGRVAGAVATVLARGGAPASVVTQAWQSPLPTARRAAWRVARAARGWSRVAADLRAAADPDADLSRLGRDGVRGWLREGAATTWGRPDARDARTIADRLRAAGLTDAEAARVAFHAGMPFEQHAFAASPASNHLDDPRPGPRGLRRWFGRRGR